LAIAWVLDHCSDHECQSIVVISLLNPLIHFKFQLLVQKLFLVLSFLISLVFFSLLFLTLFVLVL
jgi:hypothetical protein